MTAAAATGGTALPALCSFVPCSMNTLKASSSPSVRRAATGPGGVGVDDATLVNAGAAAMNSLSAIPVLHIRWARSPGW